MNIRFFPTAFFVIKVIILLIVSGCSKVDRIGSLSTTKKNALSKHDRHIKKYQGHYKIGSRYVIKSKSYTPLKSIDRYIETGVASWYGKNDHGKSTANGDTFDNNLLTAANKILPLPCVVEVLNLQNNKRLIVMVNDRGPFHKNRIIDLSEKAAELLDFKKDGIARVKVSYMKEETKKLLDKINLEPTHGKHAKKSINDSNCSVNCYIKLLNMKNNYITQKEAIY